MELMRSGRQCRYEQAGSAGQQMNCSTKRSGKMAGKSFDLRQIGRIGL
jgi:hypothetical protein